MCIISKNHEKIHKNYCHQTIVNSKYHLQSCLALVVTQIAIHEIKHSIVDRGFADNTLSITNKLVIELRRPWSYFRRLTSTPQAGYQNQRSSLCQLLPSESATNHYAGCTSSITATIAQAALSGDRWQ